MSIDPISNVNIPESSESSTFMKLDAGENRIRILGTIYDGYVLWTDGNPQRSKTPLPNNGEEKAKYFWLIPVWLKDSFGFLELTQRTIINAIKQLNYSSEWGITSEYDIAINRQGEGMDTTYTVTPCKPAPAPKEAKDAYEEIRLSIDFDQYIDSGRIIKQAVQDDDLPF